MNSQARVSEFMSSKRSASKFVGNEFNKIIAYPQNDVRDIAKIMKDIKIDCIPVVFSPWNKKLIGFIELNKIRVLLND